MGPIEFLKKINTVLVFVLLVLTIFLGGYLMIRSRKPIDTFHVSIDSMRLHKK